MQQAPPLLSIRTTQLGTVTDWLLSLFSYFVAPAAIILLSIVATVSQNYIYSTKDPTSLGFRTLADSEDTLTPHEALSQLRDKPLVDYFDTHREESPFWIELPLPNELAGQTVVELPSRHTQQATCWNATTLETLGSGNRHVTNGFMQEAKAGFALNLTEVQSKPDTLLCRLLNKGPARITAVARSPSDLTTSEQAFRHGVGLLEGGMLTLAFFTLVMAAVNREARYILLAVWLVCNLRLGALSMGWDTHWLGLAIPPDWMPQTRQLTIAAYYLVTYALFSQFFRQELPRVGYGWLLRPAQLSGLLLLLLAMVLPFAIFLPAMWVIVVLGITTMIFLLGRILVITRSRTAVWFSLAMTYVLAATVSEVIAAAFDFKLLLNILNSVTAALGSSVLVILALAEQVRSEKQERLRAQEELNRTYESTPVGLFTLDTEGNFLRTNTAMQAIMWRLRDRIPAEGRWQDYFEEGAWQTLRRIATQSGGGEAELRGVSKEGGNVRWFLVRAVDDGYCIEGSLQDITERIEATEKLRFLANHDSLTGVLNRHGIEGMLAEGVASANDFPVAAAFLDLNRFKLVNDMYRSQAGDAVLKQVAQRIQKCLGPFHELGRIGGDEFLVVMRDTSVIQAMEIGQRLITELNETPYRYGNQSFQVQASVGMIEITPDMTTASAVSAAERACRDAKKGHHGPLVVYEHDAPAFQDSHEELTLIKELGAKELPAGLHLVMQPIMSLRKPEESLNFEVLLRMNDSEGNNVPVGKVLDAAEASGNMARLDKWVLTQALQWLERHLPQLPKTRFVSVNLSGASLNDQTFVEEVFATLAQYRSVVPRICLEITEGVALNDLEYTSRFIDRAKSYGANIALDDFGAGYTSFSYLRNLQADALKIDGSFVQSMDRHPANVAIVAAIVELARNLGMRSIAEGVENASMLEALYEIGADYVQGYVIARPQPFATLLTAESAASYIKDPQIVELVKYLAETSNEVLHGVGEGPANYH